MIDNNIAKLLIANEKIAVLNEEKEKYADELTRAQKKIALLIDEKKKWADELQSVNHDLAFRDQESQKQLLELALANKKLVFENEENEKRTVELYVLKESLFNEKQLLEKTLISIGDAVISSDKDYNVVILNDVAEELTGWQRKEAVGKSIYEVFNIVNEQTRRKHEDNIKEVMINGKIHQLANHTILMSKDGRETLIENSIAPVSDAEGKTIGVVVVFRDYTEKSKRYKKIEYLSYHDELTGLYNRRFYEEELMNIDKKENLPISIIMSDVNGLKLINDSFGHEVGDEVLNKATQTFVNGCRIEDIIARVGGDEFVIVLPNTCAVEAEEILGRIQNDLQKQKINNISISLSFGIKTKTDAKQHLQDIVREAENSMYKQKLHEGYKMRIKTIDLVINALYGKSAREMLHSKRVSSICEVLAIKMGLCKDDVKLIKLAGLMHDIGKIGIAEKILNKAGKLSNAEFEEIKRHPEIGCRILNSINEFSEISEQVLQHHEKWDGTGYPQGLKGEAISMHARMLAIADSYDAMTSERAYKKVLSNAEAIKEITKCSGTQFDPSLVKIFIEKVAVT
jgi:diguanylate cyclase